MRHPYGDILPADDVLTLATEAAARLEIQVPSQSILRGRISKPEPTPLIYRGPDATLWIDRFYLAFLHDDAPWIEYLYLTRQHIIEERIASLRLWRQRGTRTRLTRLSDPIHWQFAAAWREMNRSGKGYALRPFPWPQGGAGPLDLKAAVPSLTCCWSSAPGGWTG